MPDPSVHEFSVFQFQSHVQYEQQAAILHSIDKLVRDLPGFVNRAFFYSPTERRWIDHIVWSDLAHAVASEKLLEDPEIAAAFAGIDPQSVVFTRARRVG